MEDLDFMEIALKEAQNAAEMGEVPVGAVVVFNGEIIGKGHNRREEKLDISSHAEIEAIKEAAQKLGRWDLSGCTIYVTLEPCLMCAGAILQSRIKRLVFGAKDPAKGAIVSKYSVFDEPLPEDRPLVTCGIKEKEAESLLKTFFENKRK